MRPFSIEWGGAFLLPPSHTAERFNQLLGKIEQLKLESSDEKKYLTDTANTETVFPIIQIGFGRSVGDVIRYLVLLLGLSWMGVEAGHALVFVQLGKEAPPCIFAAMRQARYFNPDCEIYLLTDQSSYRLFDREFLTGERISIVNGDALPITLEHREFRKAIDVDFTLPKSSIFYTLDRFFYLFDFVEEGGVENLFHLENDTLLYADLNELMPLFQGAGIRLATPFLSARAAVPCFVFIKDKEVFRPLIEYTVAWAKSYQGAQAYLGVSDMKALAYFYREFGSGSLTPLPTLMAEYGYPKRQSLVPADNGTALSFLFTNGDLFPGYLFDAATLGVFANGNDRKYAPNSQPGTVHFRSLFDPRYFSFFWGKDAKDRAAPYLSFKGKNYAIVNLHLHSKMAEQFTSYGQTRASFP